jgi:23S rRNA U2552 (ribose-2'-O)-methylase RlmE/FtsJ
MVDLKALHEQFILDHLKEGDVAVDFTMGNGNDTLFLSKSVGESGRVYAFDIQPLALESTSALLKENNAPENTKLILASHHLVKDYVKEPFKAGMFNLGYLPRSGNKQITTMRETTLIAVKSAIDLLLPDGVIVLAVYPGHEEGYLEGKMLDEYFKTISRFYVNISKFEIINSPGSPFFFILEKTPKAPYPVIE